MTRTLEIRHGDELLGTLHFSKVGRATLRYSPNVIETLQPGVPGISCSLPVSADSLDATGWCRGVLPEGQHLSALARDIGVAESDTYALLRAYGRDIAGALEIIDSSRPARAAPGLVPYSDEAFCSDVLAASRGELSLGIRDDSELSLAGVQNKLLIVRTSSGWARPTGGYPSTHILKTDQSAYPGLVAAEHAALQLARAMGLDAATSDLIAVEDQSCIVVERFDRAVLHGTITRVHQEDLLQALGIDPASRRSRAKYQDGPTGPPSLWHLAELLAKYGWREERFQLLASVFFNVLIGNADAHAKNYSLLLGDQGSPLQGTIGLAPLYDTVPTLLWPTLRDRNALQVGDQHLVSSTTSKDLEREAIRWGLASALVKEAIGELAAAARREVTKVEHDGLRTLVEARLARFERT